MNWRVGCSISQLISRFGLLFLLLLGLGSSSLHAQQPAKTLTVGTWNLEWFYDHEAGDNRSKLAKEKTAPSQAEWQWKVAGVADVLSKIRPDIMAFQEIENKKVLYDLRDAVRKKSGLSYRVAFIEGFDSFTEQDVGIIFRSGLVEFSRREQNQRQWESKKFYNLSKHIIGRFEWEENGDRQELLLLNTHLRAMPEREELRIKQIKLIRQWLEEDLQAGKNVMVMGDLNTEHGFGTEKNDSDISVLRGLNDRAADNDLYDAHQFIAQPQRATHLTGKQFDRILFSQSLLKDSPQRVDLVFQSAYVGSKWVVRNKVDSGDVRWNSQYSIPQDERDVSDHYPVVAKFEFK